MILQLIWDNMLIICALGLFLTYFIEKVIDESVLKHER